MLFIILTSMGNIMTKIIFIKYIVLSILAVLTFWNSALMFLYVFNATLSFDKVAFFIKLSFVKIEFSMKI